MKKPWWANWQSRFSQKEEGASSNLAQGIRKRKEEQIFSDTDLEKHRFSSPWCNGSMTDC